MTYLLILGVLALVWFWGFRVVIRRLLVLLAIPILHLHYLRKAEDPLAFQAWTLLVLAALLLWGAVRLFRYFRSFRS
jgi:hypothetical protein